MGRLPERLVKRIPSDKRGRKRRRPPRQPSRQPALPVNLEPGEMLAAENLLALAPPAKAREITVLVRELRRGGYDLGWIDKVVTAVWIKKYGMPELVQAERRRVEFLTKLNAAIAAARRYQAHPHPATRVVDKVLALEAEINDAAPLETRDPVTFPIKPPWSPKPRRGPTDTGWPEADADLRDRGVGGRLRRRIKSVFAL